MEHKPRSRNPVGIVTNKPIALRLQTDERQQAEKLSKEHSASMSVLAARAYRLGLPILLKELELEAS